MNKINFLRCFEMKYKVKKNKINEKKDVLPDKKITKHTSDTIKIYKNYFFFITNKNIIHG